MKKGFYFRLARTGIHKNGKLYYPYILTCICMVMMFYVVAFLSVSSEFHKMPGGSTLQSLMQFGVGVIGIFSLIFLYYTNSFLIRRRKREFGLYHILGMGKRNLIKILFWENVITAVVSVVCGLALGVLFSKMGELAAARIVGGSVGFGMEIRPDVMQQTVVLFLGIFFLIMLRMILHIVRSRPVELLRSESVGEKPPRANWILAVVGIVILAAAYYIAVAIEEPVTAIFLFFVAVVMVIVATFLLFIAGSVALCRLLQKHSWYYYKTKHFVSLSSMIYRMKRNGAGLASICILSTMVLVTVSSTVCLYAGTEEGLNQRYPKDLTFNIYSGDMADEIMPVYEKVDHILDEYGVEKKDTVSYRMLSFTAFQNEDQMSLGMGAERGADAVVSVRSIYVVPLEDYNAVMDTEETLDDGEVLMYVPRKDYDYAYDTFTLESCGSWNVKKHVSEFVTEGMMTANMTISYVIVVKDMSVMEQICEAQAEAYGINQSLIYGYYGMNLDCKEELQKEIYQDVREEVQGKNTEINATVVVESRAFEKSSYYGLTGGLFFLGILLGAVFLFGTILIMYYKQISEGYEDQGRFTILMKVGMSPGEIRQSIRSQMLTVFFLPLLTAGIHLLFAFPLISKLLMLMIATNYSFLRNVTIACYVIFAGFYVIVYAVTSKQYGDIVIGKKGKE